MSRKESETDAAPRTGTRRTFLKLCGGIAVLAGANPRLLATPEAGITAYARARLVTASGEPVRSSALRVGVSHIFHYPYAATPCFLLNLGRRVPGGQRLMTEDGHSYAWTGGVGPAQSVVAFSAICAHRMSYPAREVSFINYRHEPTKYLDANAAHHVRPQVIACCSENSVYDATAGARVLGGPARQPLAAILLEHDPQEDALYAVGAQGGTLFDKFVREFGPQLGLNRGGAAVDAPVHGETTVLPIEEYTRNQIRC